MSDPLTFIDEFGVHVGRLDQRVAQITASMQAIVGTDTDFSPSSPDGQLVGILAKLVADRDELIGLAFNASTPAGAQGAQLARLARLNGVTKQGAQHSTVSVTVTGTPGTVITNGALVASDLDDTIKFTLAGVTIPGGGSTTTLATSVDTGPVHAPAGHLTVIKTTIPGWTTVTNPLNAALGSNAETDPQLRIRRTASVGTPSQGLVDGLRGSILGLANVAGCVVYENATGFPVTQGSTTIPAHSIQVIVDGGDPADIAATIWLKKGMGVGMVGAQVVTTPDATGTPQTVRFDRPVDTNIYVTVTLATAANATIKTQMKDAIVQWGDDNSVIGVAVPWFQLGVPINPFGLDVLSVAIGTAPSPTLQQDIPVDFNAIARWDASRIIVNP